MFEELKTIAFKYNYPRQPKLRHNEDVLCYDLGELVAGRFLGYSRCPNKEICSIKLCRGKIRLSCREKPGCYYYGYYQRSTGRYVPVLLVFPIKSKAANYIQLLQVFKQL